MQGGPVRYVRSQMSQNKWMPMGPQSGNTMSPLWLSWHTPATG